jgi:hypothetical protein
MNQRLKLIGMALMSVGFLWGSLVCVQQLKAVAWGSWAAAALLTAVGAVVIRLSQRVSGERAEELGKDIAVIEESLDALVAAITTMNADREESKVRSFPKRIDDSCMDAINDFVEAREAVIHRYGLPVYARLMDSFALAERALNRAWCASADGYIDELHSCLDRAEMRIKEARGVLESAASTAQD